MFLDMYLRILNPQKIYLPEKLLQIMIVDQRKLIRELVFRIIIKAKMIASKTEPMCFWSPHYTDYFELNEWNTTAFSPPPWLQRVSDEVCAKITAGETTDK